MPTITIIYEDLLKLIGKKIPLDQLEEILFQTKCQVETINDGEITLEVMADRPDLLSTEGISRELKGILGIEKGLEKYEVGRSDVKITVDPSVKNVRPYISSSIVRKIELDDEGVRQVMQLQEKLHLTYCRRRRKVSIGIHDLDSIEHNVFYAGIEAAKIRFVPLDEKREMTGKEILELVPKGREYGHIIKDFPRYPLLFDSEGSVLSMPPIINGTVTKVTENTKNLLLDVTGTDPDLVEFVNNIMVTNLVERGGKIEDVRIIHKDRARYAPKLGPYRIKFKTDFMNEILGLKLEKSQIIESLKRMRYGIKKTGENHIEVLVPAYRADILHEIDIIEDVALGYGYNRLELEMPLISTMGVEKEINRFMRKACNLMMGLGFQEVLNYIMTNRRTLFDKMSIPEVAIAEIENPLTVEYSILRNSLLPGLINFLSYNKHVSFPQKIFECGDVVILDNNRPTKSRNERKLAATICDYKVSYEDIQGVNHTFLKNVGVENWSLKKAENPSFIKGRVASIHIDKIEEAVGIMGEINPSVLNNFELENPVVAFEIELENIVGIAH